MRASRRITAVALGAVLSGGVVVTATTPASAGEVTYQSAKLRFDPWQRENWTVTCPEGTVITNVGNGERNNGNISVDHTQTREIDERSTRVSIWNGTSNAQVIRVRYTCNGTPLHPVTVKYPDFVNDCNVNTTSCKVELDGTNGNRRTLWEVMDEAPPYYNCDDKADGNQSLTYNRGQWASYSYSSGSSFGYTFTGAESALTMALSAEVQKSQTWTWTNTFNVSESVDIPVAARHKGTLKYVAPIEHVDMKVTLTYPVGVYPDAVGESTNNDSKVWNQTITAKTLNTEGFNPKAGFVSDSALMSDAEQQQHCGGLGPQLGRNFLIRMNLNRDPGLYVDVPDRSLDNGKALQLWPVNSWNLQDNQTWLVTDSDEDGYYELRNKLSGKCMDVRGGSKAERAEVIQYACKSTGNANQEWSFIKKNNYTSEYYIVNRNSNLSLSSNESCSSTTASSDWYHRALVQRARPTSTGCQTFTLH
ncbi:RICIN domain-containing protein [Streptomyces sp. TRM64462]|uniref:RICIN domain-containing protein n=1 Tax=Streptomyces sp. TRM64462 TaxID=2741726 RepID=UPI0015860845|nr:RICIN domain-containing protein [Streptomyces sp. TRM64462]